jgi:hypothetical protein
MLSPLCSLFPAESASIIPRITATSRKHPLLLEGQKYYTITKRKMHYSGLVGHFPTRHHFTSNASRIRCKGFDKAPTQDELPQLVVAERFRVELIPPYGRFLQHMETSIVKGASLSMMMLGTDTNYVDQQVVAKREYWSVHDTNSHRTNNNLERFHTDYLGRVTHR